MDDPKNSSRTDAKGRDPTRYRPIMPLQSTQVSSSLKRSAPCDESNLEHGNVKQSKTTHDLGGLHDLNQVDFDDAHYLSSVPQVPHIPETNFVWADFASYSSYDMTSGNVMSGLPTQAEYFNDTISSDNNALCFPNPFQSTLDLQQDERYNVDQNLPISMFPSVPTPSDDQNAVSADNSVFGHLNEEVHAPGDEITVEKPWKCGSCSNMYAYYDSANRHWKCKHPGEEPTEPIDTVGNSPRRPLSKTARSGRSPRQSQLSVQTNSIQSQGEVMATSQLEFNNNPDPAIYASTSSAPMLVPAQAPIFTPAPMVMTEHQFFVPAYNPILSVPEMSVPQDVVAYDPLPTNAIVLGDPDRHRLEVNRTAGGKGNGQVSPVIRNKLQPLAENGSIPPLPTTGTYHTRDRTLDFDAILGTYVRGHAHEREIWDAATGHWVKM